MSSPVTTPTPSLDHDARAALRAAKRDAILIAAAHMFNKRGYHATSLDDVAASLGISKPVVYHYLGNKEQVLVQCMERGLSELQAAFDRVQAEAGPGIDRLRAYLVAYAQVNMSDFGCCVIRTGDEVLSPDNRRRFRDMKRRIDAALRMLLAAAVTDGSAAAADIRFSAFAIAGALNWPARWYKQDGTGTPREIAEYLADFLIAGLRPRGA